MAFVWSYVFHDIERNRILHIKGRKIKNIFHPVFRYKIKKLFRRISMGVYKSQPFTILNILNGHIDEKSRLTHSRLTYSVKMLRTLLGFYAERRLLASCISNSKVSYAIGVIFSH